MEQQKQVEAFAGRLTSPGYTGEFTSFDGDTGQLERVLHQFLQKNAASIEQTGNAFTTLSTATNGILNSRAFTAAHFLVDYEKEKGFIAGQLGVSRVEADNLPGKNHTYKLNGMEMIPDTASVNRESLLSVQQANQKSRHRHGP
jgi:hypothetical protein